MVMKTGHKIVKLPIADADIFGRYSQYPIANTIIGTTLEEDLLWGCASLQFSSYYITELLCTAGRIQHKFTCFGHIMVAHYSSNRTVSPSPSS